MSTKFRSERLHRGWTLQQIEAMCRDKGVPITNGQLSRIERGVAVPRPALRAALAELLELDPVADFEPSDQREAS